ncbi:substrate-binding periplasmic protein [Yoonia maritima]|uniref:substrate-binding periplasmic protein n=1 Tax=Yoonia maritima TaxID=1435347 RepID=UPI0037365212
MNRFLFTAICVFLGNVLPNSSAAESLTITGPVLGERLLNEEGQGFYGDLISEILASVSAPHAFTPLPFKRALSSFASSDVDCMWGFDRTFLTKFDIDVTELKSSQIVFYSTQHIFMAPGREAISKLDELDGLRVGMGIGSNLETRLNETDAIIVELADQDSKFRMLTNNRLDAVGSWLPDILILSSDENIDPTIFSTSPPFGATGVALVCHPSPQSEAFVSEVNLAIAEYVQSEKFDKLFQRYGAESMLQNILR